MFYVLDFHSHRFTTCETVEKVNEKLKQLQDSGVAEDEISVINRLVDDCEMSINAYRDFARSYCWTRKGEVKNESGNGKS